MGKTKTASLSANGSARGIKPDAFKVSKNSVVQSKTVEDVRPYEVNRIASVVPAFEELGNLPESYGEEVLYLVARDPHWLFCYWDIDWTKYPKVKMLGGERRVFLRITTEGGVHESQIEINTEAKNWYLPVTQTGTRYWAELGFHDARGIWKSIVGSLPAETPASKLSEEAKTSFATIPFHLTFQRIIEMVRDSRRADEDLSQTLSRLQSEGRMSAIEAGACNDLTEEQRNILATLFGTDILEKLRMGSGEIERLLRKYLSEKLSSETASGIQAGFTNETSSLSSGLKGWSPEVSSLFSALVGWGPEVSSLFSAAGGWTPEVSSLFSGMGGWGPEVSSLFSAMGGWGPEVSSLFSAMGGWGPEVTSLFSGINFAGPELTHLSSLSSGIGLWGQELTSLSSGVGASWSAQPFGQSHNREFFMHVNAEVIFYGGTHPDAKVWIDGKQIQLNADGSFRYHYKFPDGDYHIPVVAISPDKVEERSATLGFKRGTARRGDVGHTPQPRDLQSIKAKG